MRPRAATVRTVLGRAVLGRAVLGRTVLGRRTLVTRTLLAVGVVGAVAVPWLTDGYTTAVLARVLLLGVVAVSVALLTGVAGLPTLGQTAPYAAGAYTAGYLAGHGHPVGLLGLLAAAGAGAVFALVTAPLIVYARGVLMLMVTVAIGELTTVAAGRFKAVTGGSDGLAAIDAGPAVWGTPVLASDRARYLYVLVVTGVVVGVVLLVLRGPAGLLLATTRDDEARMRASGHRVTRYLCLAYVAAGTIAGIGGSLLVTAQQYISPADFGFDVAALLLLAVVLGGSASVPGAVAGAAVVFWTRDWLAGLFPGHAPLVLGTLFLVTVYLLPRGVAGLASGSPVAGAPVPARVPRQRPAAPTAPAGERSQP